jgi:hypothetical protein
MDRATIKQWGIAVALGAVAVAATWLYTASTHRVRITEISSTACGPASFGFPLALLGETAASLPVGVGPIGGDGLSRPLNLIFDPTLSPIDRELTLQNGYLSLPSTFGRDPATPERISLNCRDGTVVSVRYTGGAPATTFNVTVVDTDMPDVAWEDVLATDNEEAAGN